MGIVSRTTLDILPIDLPELGPDDELVKETVPHTEATDERSLARRLALQALYEIDSAGHEIGTVMNAQRQGIDDPIPSNVAEGIQRLVLGVTQSRSQIDHIIHAFAPEFPVAQVAIIDRNILRMAIFEFALTRTAPVGVAIDEAVELAKLFGSEGSPRFINGVLGALADDKEMVNKIAAEYAALQPSSE